MTLKFSEKSHRYWLDGKPVTGATTILGRGIPKPALMPWACKVIAEYVDTNIREVIALHRSGELQGFLKRLPNRRRDDAAMRGTEIHAVAQQYLAGEEVEIPLEHEPEIMALVEFIEDVDLRPIIVESSLANRTHWYSGRVDFIGTSPKINFGDPFLMDWKTSNSVYGETALQCAAYAMADFWVSDDDPETEHPLPEVTATFVGHIQPGAFTLHPLAESRAEIKQHFRDFKAALHTAKNTDKRKSYVKPPVWEKRI